MLIEMGYGLRKLRNIVINSDHLAASSSGQYTLAVMWLD